QLLRYPFCGTQIPTAEPAGNADACSVREQRSRWNLLGIVRVRVDSRELVVVASERRKRQRNPHSHSENSCIRHVSMTGRGLLSNANVETPTFCVGQHH